MAEANQLLPGHLSARAARAIRPALSYFKAFMEAQARQWSPDDPEGNIILSVAENRLTADVVQERLSRSAADFPQSSLCYQDMRGLPRLRKALAALLESTFMKGITVDPHHLTVSAGAGAILENLFFCIAGQGDAVLIPSPYYPAFDNDLQVKCGVRPWPFPLDEDRPIGPQLDAAAAAAAAAPLTDGSTTAADGPPSGDGTTIGGSDGFQRRRVAALLITTPNNPLGTMYRRETIVEMLRWCLARGVHLVSDEIYGNSVFGEGRSFTSTEVVAMQEVAGLPLSHRLSELLHVVFGASKDLCASGLRVGCLHTRNTSLIQALDNLGYFCAVPGPQQCALAAALEDKEWLDGFLETNRGRLREAYGKLEGALVAAGISHVKADSAMFCWIDLRHWLPEASWEGEAKLWEEMCRECRVLLTPGEQCHATDPGFFRVCWAWVPADALPVAVARLAAHFEGRKKAAKREREHEEEGGEEGKEGKSRRQEEEEQEGGEGAQQPAEQEGQQQQDGQGEGKESKVEDGGGGE